MSEARDEVRERPRVDGPRRISAEEVIQRLARHEPIAIIDTRSPEAWDKSDQKIAGAMRLPVHQIEQRLEEIPRDRTVVTYCT